MPPAPEKSRSPSSVTVESAPTVTLSVSENDVAESAPVNVTIPSPIVTAPKVALRSALIVAAMFRDVKSIASPAPGAALQYQLPGVDILPSPASPVQEYADGLPTVRTRMSPSTLHA